MNTILNRITKNKHSIFTRIVALFVLVIVLDVSALIGLLFSSGTFDRMHDDALDFLYETTRNKHQTVESKMLSWSELDDLSIAVDEAVRSTLIEQNKDYVSIEEDAVLNALLVEQCANVLISHLSQADVTGVFMMLDGKGVPDEENSYAGVYIRNFAVSTSVSNANNFHLLRGLPPLARETGITLSSSWTPSFQFEGGKDNPLYDYFFDPISAYEASKEISKKPAKEKFFGRWSSTITIGNLDSIPVLIYTRPLVNSNGDAYGVIGIEISELHLSEIINNDLYHAIDSDCFFYVGITTDQNKSFQNVLHSGVQFKQNFYESTGNHHSTSSSIIDEKTFITLMGTRSNQEFTGSVYPLALYSSSTAFANEQWVVIGMQDSQTLFGLEHEMKNILITVTIIGLLLGLLIAVLAARSISNPVTFLIGQMRDPSRDPTTAFKPTGLNEVDVLADTISDLNSYLMEEASRISEIIKLSGLPVGAFEKRADRPMVFCSDGVFKLLHCENVRVQGNHISEENFHAMLSMRLQVQSELPENTYLMETNNEKRYLKVEKHQDQHGLIGTVLDVTEEIQNRRRIERERDYDLLTGLLNRRAFESRVSEFFNQRQSELGPVAALVMLDMDNLKAVNDTYGHDCGDQYIRVFADALEHLRDERFIAARRSGDEFYLFYYGYQSQDEIRQIIGEGWHKMRSVTFTFPDGSVSKVRGSAGVAWYPDDADESNRLVHYADFAMYRVKNAAKGSLEEFSSLDYVEAGY